MIDLKKQKSITPEDPRLFLAPEYADTILGVRKDLELFRSEVAKKLIDRKQSLRNKMSHLIFKKRSDEVKNLTLVLKYIHLVEQDLDAMIDNNKYPYRDVIYTMYYYSRIRGVF